MSSISVGDLVVRKSHCKDIVFKVCNILADSSGRQYGVLKGMHLRLLADAPLEDLERVGADHLRNELLRTENLHNETLRRIMRRRGLERELVGMSRGEHGKQYSFFDLPGRVLHIDGDNEYLAMCLKTYSQLKIEAVGRCIEEGKQPEKVVELLSEFNPDILILTGHDALVGNGKKDFSNINHYRNSKFYVQSVKNARTFEPAKDDLVIFAGACQSYFEAILAAGANFASSPTRIFIHAYDPVFIAEKVAFTPIHKDAIKSIKITPVYKAGV
mgnify:CR=1 FL=1